MYLYIYITSAIFKKPPIFKTRWASITYSTKLVPINDYGEKKVKKVKNLTARNKHHHVQSYKTKDSDVY